jgi:hypothetical protein
MRNVPAEIPEIRNKPVASVVAISRRLPDGAWRAMVAPLMGLPVESTTVPITSNARAGVARMVRAQMENSSRKREIRRGIARWQGSSRTWDLALACGCILGQDFGRRGCGTGRGLFAKRFNGAAEARGEFVGLANVHTLGRDGLTYGEREAAGIEMARVDG